MYANARHLTLYYNHAWRLGVPLIACLFIINTLLYSLNSWRYVKSYAVCVDVRSTKTTGSEPKQFIKLHGTALPLCNFNFLKYHALSAQEFATIPFDQLGQSKNVSERQQSKPANCTFFDERITVKHHENESQCIRLQNISSILLMGDSNGRRYADALVEILKKTGWKCTAVKKENARNIFDPDPIYYVKEPNIKLEHIRYHPKECKGCKSVLKKCKRQGRKTLMVEFLSTQYFIDTEVTTMRTRRSTCSDQTFCEHSDTHQEFIFREYLVGRYPDVVFFFASDHDKNRHTLKRIKLAAEYFFSIVESYLPADSYFIAMNLMKQLTNLQPKIWRDAVYEFNNLTTNELLKHENKIIFDVMKSRLVDPKLNWYAFPSLFDESTTTDHMYVDGVHRTSDWYSYIARCLLQLICFK